MEVSQSRRWLMALDLCLCPVHEGLLGLRTDIRRLHCPHPCCPWSPPKMGTSSAVSFPCVSVMFTPSLSLRMFPSFPEPTLHMFQGKPASLYLPHLSVCVLSPPAWQFSQDAALPGRILPCPVRRRVKIRGCCSLRFLVLVQSFILPALF